MTLEQAARFVVAELDEYLETMPADATSRKLRDCLRAALAAPVGEGQRLEQLVLRWDDTRSAYFSWNASTDTHAQLLALEDAFNEAHALLVAAAQRIRDTAAHESAEAAGEQSAAPPCDHEWVDARNAVVKSGEWCRKCSAIRASAPTESCAPAAGPSAGLTDWCSDCEQLSSLGPCSEHAAPASHAVGLQAEPVAHWSDAYDAWHKQTGLGQPGAPTAFYAGWTAAQERPAERAQTAGRIDRCGPRSVAFVTIDGDEAKFIYAGDSDIGAVVLDAWFAERAATGATP